MPDQPKCPKCGRELFQYIHETTWLCTFCEKAWTEEYLKSPRITAIQTVTLADIVKEYSS